MLKSQHLTIYIYTLYLESTSECTTWWWPPEGRKHVVVVIGIPPMLPN